MALAQRPASRFFAAFYRWSRYTRQSSSSSYWQQPLRLGGSTERPSPCSLTSQAPYAARRLVSTANTRCYHATCRLREEQSLREEHSSHRGQSMQEEETGTGGVQDIHKAPVEIEAAQLRDNTRHLMRKVPASVAVITVAHFDLECNKHVPMGIAVSSLSTVTLDPPTISFNVKQPSKALNAIRAANGRFRVHFLNGQRMSSKIIESFCKGNHPEAYEHRNQHLRIYVPQFDSSSGAKTSLAPQIRGKSVRAAAECTLTQELTVGDHVILVAQVNSLESTNEEEPTIAYVDGTYRSLDLGSVIGRHQQSTGAKQPAAEQQAAAQTKAEQASAARAQELSIAYDFPLLPGERERREYAERLKAYFKGLQPSTIRKFVRDLQPETKLISKSFGVDLEALVFFCQHGVLKKDQQILPEFYGQLSSAQLAKVVDRAKQLVKADARFLEVGYTDLLRYLDVKIGSNSLLPSDILEALRAEGLVGRFQPSGSQLHTYGRNRNILLLEEVELAVREQLSNLEDKEILRTPLSIIFERAGVNPRELMHFQESTRLKVEMCSNFYSDWKIDIAGDLTSEEALVVVRRLISYLRIDREDVFEMRIFEQVSDMLRNIGVHPLVTGVNTTFIVSKIRSLFSSTEDFSALKDNVEEMLQPYFASNTTWEDLETRIKQFVQKLPLRAITWRARDQMAAMGLSGNTIIQTPLSSTSRSLDDSNLLETLMAKALKNHYGNGTDEENEAIAAFLKTRYGFDVVGRSVAVAPGEDLARSSADDLEAARLAHQEVPVQLKNIKAPS